MTFRIHNFHFNALKADILFLYFFNLYMSFNLYTSIDRLRLRVNYRYHQPQQREPCVCPDTLPYSFNVPLAALTSESGYFREQP